MMPFGIVESNVYHKGQNYTLKCEVVVRNLSNTIGQTDNLRLGIVKRVYSVTNNDIIGDNPENISSAANDVFGKIGCVPGFIWNWDQIFHQVLHHLDLRL